MFSSGVGKICWRRDRLPTPIFLGFPCGSAGKESASNAGDLSSILGLGRSPGEGKGDPLQYSSLENSMDCTVRGVAKSWTWLSNCHFHLVISLSFGLWPCPPHPFPVQFVSLIYLSTHLPGYWEWSRKVLEDIKLVLTDAKILASMHWCQIKSRR